MKEHIWIKELPNQDVSVYQYGYEECDSEHSYGPANRDHYILHFIKSGKGVFKANNKSYSLKAGQGFLIFPNNIASYKADKDNPWVYYWIGFNGTNVRYFIKESGLSVENPIFSFDNFALFTDIFSQLMSVDRSSLSGRLKMTGSMYSILAEMIDNTNILKIQKQVVYNTKEEYIKTAVEFIEQNFSHKMTVNDISRFIGLNRCYFCVIFKEILGTTPMDYLISYRMDRAKKLLLDVSMNIGDVSRSVGYDDSLAFSKMFKKYIGVSPRAYRRQNV